MKKLVFLTTIILSTASIAQTWADDVADIVYNKCAQCHNPNGVAPFSLVTYADASPMVSSFFAAINGDVMPPWPPDNNYQTYIHDRSLTPAEKTTMLDWINNGAPEGNPANTPPPPVFPTGALYGSGDLEVQIPTYMSKATTSDDYVCFALPSNLASERYIKAIEIVPGNREIVHHALIYLDPLSSSTTDTVGGNCGGPSGNSASLVMGYTPGGSPLIMPTSAPLKLGIKMPANSQVIFAMHYPEGSYGQFDSTKVIFHFYPPGETGIREVSAAPILQNWSFSLPPEQITPVSAQYPPTGGLPISYSIMSVFPHMHMIGKSMEVYSLSATNDTTKLIKIPEWDFEWQDFYIFKNMQKVVAGSVLHAEGLFDNTSTNPHNPNSPPITVNAGLNTSDEMFLTYFHFLPYQNGDETYDMDSLIQLTGLGVAENIQTESFLEVYPNPFSGSVEIQHNNLKAGDVVSLFVYDQMGNLIQKLMDKNVLFEDQLKIRWNGKNQADSPVSSGLYYISLNVNGQLINQRLIKR